MFFCCFWARLEASSSPPPPLRFFFLRPPVQIRNRKRLHEDGKGDGAEGQEEGEGEEDEEELERKRRKRIRDLTRKELARQKSGAVEKDERKSVLSFFPPSLLLSLSPFFCKLQTHNTHTHTTAMRRRMSYNSLRSDSNTVSQEEMEAYRLAKLNWEDPLKK